MVFDTYGNKDNKSILMIHPMFTSKDYFKDKIELLTKEYFLILPTLSGHYYKSIYRSMKDEMDCIDKFLQENGIKKLNFIVGFSLGGNIAYSYFCTHPDLVEYAVIDSAPIFKFPKFIKKRFYNKYKKCLLKIKQNNVDIAKELNKCFNGMGQMQKVIAPKVDLQSLLGLIESCYNVPLYDMSADIQSRLTFVYGSKDIARFCLPRIKRYRSAKFVKVKNCNHCGYFMNNVTDYITEFLEK